MLINANLGCVKAHSFLLALFLFVDFMDVYFAMRVGDFYAVFFEFIPKGE